MAIALGHLVNPTFSLTAEHRTRAKRCKRDSIFACIARELLPILPSPPFLHSLQTFPLNIIDRRLRSQLMQSRLR